MGSMQVPVRVEDTLDCPACGKSIIPQWTFLGREYMLLVGGLGVESHDKGRLCPLCGVDVDRWPIEQEKFRKQREAEKAEQVRRAALTPRKAAVEYAWDRVALLVAAIVLLGIMLLCAGRVEIFNAGPQRPVARSVFVVDCLRRQGGEFFRGDGLLVEFGQDLVQGTQ